MSKLAAFGQLWEKINELTLSVSYQGGELERLTESLTKVLGLRQAVMAHNQVIENLQTQVDTLKDALAVANNKVDALSRVPRLDPPSDPDPETKH